MTGRRRKPPRAAFDAIRRQGAPGAADDGWAAIGSTRSAASRSSQDCADIANSNLNVWRAGSSVEVGAILRSAQSAFSLPRSTCLQCRFSRRVLWSQTRSRYLCLRHERARIPSSLRFPFCALVRMPARRDAHDGESPLPSGIARLGSRESARPEVGLEHEVLSPAQLHDQNRSPQDRFALAPRVLQHPTDHR